MGKIHGYAPIDGLNMYYEIEGDGEPIAFIQRHLAVAGVNTLPALARTHRVITLDVQGHGRTADLPARPMSLHQNAKDVIGLLQHLGISKADLLGESYGGATALLIALHRPDLVRRVATYGATFGPAEDAHNREMLRFDEPPTPDSRCFRFQRDNYQKVAPDPAYWSTFWERGGRIQWNGFSDEDLASLRAPVLIALGDHDFVRVEHAVAAFRRIPNAELAIIPDAGHFALDSEQDRVVPIIEHFLTKPEARLPLATAGLGYRPGETR
jgi:pimeloyl-ACP methyl ester carboxylesterase